MMIDLKVHILTCLKSMPHEGTTKLFFNKSQFENLLNQSIAILQNLPEFNKFKSIPAEYAPALRQSIHTCMVPTTNNRLLESAIEYIDGDLDEKSYGYSLLARINTAINSVLLTALPPTHAQPEADLKMNKSVRFNSFLNRGMVRARQIQYQCPMIFSIKLQQSILRDKLAHDFRDKLLKPAKNLKDEAMKVTEKGKVSSLVRYFSKLGKP